MGREPTHGLESTSRAQSEQPKLRGAPQRSSPESCALEHHEQVQQLGGRQRRRSALKSIEIALETNRHYLLINVFRFEGCSLRRNSVQHSATVYIEEDAPNAHRGCSRRETDESRESNTRLMPASTLRGPP
jgi:hypothetical protein